MGDLFFKKLQELEGLDMVGDIRGLGLFIGIEFVAEKETKRPFPAEVTFSKKVTKRLFENGLVVLPGGGGIDGTLGDHILIAPPFTVKESEIDEMVKILKRSLLEVEDLLDKEEQK
jgi:adenosylmethionine-8-amino-7-oxononanoate aminotransferase